MFHQRFEQTPALVLAAQTMDVFVRDGRGDDAIALLIHLAMDVSPYFDSGLAT